MKILVVDDNHDTTTTAAMLLETFGHDVRTANDGPAALEVARSFRPQVIILDIGLPGMSGYEVAQSLRQEGFANATIVAVSGYGQEDDRRRSLEAGFDHHFVKPIDYVQLLDVLQKTNIAPALAE